MREIRRSREGFVEKEPGSGWLSCFWQKVKPGELFVYVYFMDLGGRLRSGVQAFGSHCEK